jgi:hypothetical protein
MDLSGRMITNGHQLLKALLARVIRQLSVLTLAVTARKTGA